MFSRVWFFGVDKKLRECGLDSDAQSFDEILSNMKNRKIYDADEFASHCIYVILAGGFSQKTAKIKHAEIINVLVRSGADYNTLIGISPSRVYNILKELGYKISDFELKD